MPVQLDKGRSTIPQFNVTWEIIIRCSAWQIYSSMVSVPKWTRSQSIPFEMCISDMLQASYKILVPAKQPSPAGPPKRLPQCRSLTQSIGQWSTPRDRQKMQSWASPTCFVSGETWRLFLDVQLIWTHQILCISLGYTVKISTIVPLLVGNELASKEHQTVSTGVRRWRFQPLKLQHRAALALWRCFTERRKKSLVSLGNSTMESSNRHHVMGTFNHCFQVIELSHPNISWKLFPLFGATHTNASRKRWRNLEGIEKSEGSKHSLEQV